MFFLNKRPSAGCLRIKCSKRFLKVAEEGGFIRRQFLTVRHHVCKITKPSIKSVLFQNKEKHIFIQSDDHGKVNINAFV